MQSHRGPDGTGWWDDGCAYLGHNRLAILDLSENANQPMFSDDGRYVLIFNGEIYNFQTLRERLERRGRRFRSTSDTEVLLYWLIEHGVAGVEDLYGIFAFGLWDRERRRLLAARDPFGVKPFHFAFDAGRFVFASEIKTLAAAGVPVEFDEATLEELLVFRFTAGARTPFRGIERLLPGETLVWEQGQVARARYWTPLELLDAEPATDPRAYVDVFDEIVDMERVADVPVGVLLSGGLDSSAVAASLARHAGSHVEAFHVSFEEEGYDEHPEAEDVARMWGLSLHSRRTPPGRVYELFGTAQRLHDEPLAHANDAYIYEIARLAREHVKVLLSGEGADETLGGYVRYRPLLLAPAVGAFARLGALRAVKRLRPGLAPRLTKLERFMARDGAEDLGFYNTVNVTPWELEEVLGLDMQDDFAFRRDVWATLQQRGGNLLTRTMAYDQMTFLCSLLDRNDRMTMGASIECRVPFLAPRLARVAAGHSPWSLFDRWGGKRPFRRGLEGRLPESVLHKRKWGFGVPWEQYLKQDPACAAVLHRVRHEGARWTSRLGKREVEKVFRAYEAGDRVAYFAVLALFFLELWAERALEPLAEASRQARTAPAHGLPAGPVPNAR